MLTKNFYALMRTALGKTSSTVTTIENTKKTVSMNNSTWYGVFGAMNYYETNGYQYVRFGSGTTPATVNDYVLENQINSGITVSNPSTVTTEQTDSYISWTVTFGVSALVETTISEVGLIAKAYMSQGEASTLVDHTVLESPITIPAGQSKQITYTIRFNYGDTV